MTRPLRVEYPGALWHVTNRGVEKRTIYLNDVDRVCFLRLLADAITKCGWQLNAYALMSNHYHLLFQTPHANLSRGMQLLDGEYASAFNLRHARVGHLFAGRFQSHLIDSDGYLLEVARYIVLNPVRAGIVERAADWRWSSYRATAGLAAVPPWLDPSPILERFDADDWQRAMIEYREFVAAPGGQCASPWEHLLAQTFLGQPEFLRDIEEKVRALRRSREHPHEQRTFRAVTLDDIREALEGRWPPRIHSPRRLLFVLLATRRTHASRAQIGRALGITGAGARHLLRIAIERMQSDLAFAARVVAVESNLTDVELTLTV